MHKKYCMLDKLNPESFLLQDNSPKSYSSNTSSGSTKIIELLVKCANDTWITHVLNESKTISTHEALGDYYDSLIDFIDRFTEPTLVDNNITEIKISGPFEKIKKGQLVSYYDGIYKDIQKYRSIYKEGYQQNILDEISEATKKLIYKLTHMPD